VEYFVGAGLAVGVAAFARLSGFDRDRAFYPTTLVVIASYYDLFAIMGGEPASLAIETIVLAGFICISVIGFKTNLWIVAGALAAHGIFDLMHGQLIENVGVPAWWPMFCVGYDVVAGGLLARLISSGRLAAVARPGFGARIRPHVQAELAAAAVSEQAGDLAASFRHLERAHILGQTSTVEHVRVHGRMLVWGLRRRNVREVTGQMQRIAGAAVVTGLGLVPHGNTGGSNVSAFKPMPIPEDLSAIIARARTMAGGFVSLVLLAATFLGVGACSAAPQQAGVSVVDDYPIAYQVLGSGKPVVVMISGLGDGMATFQNVAPEIAKSATVIIYDRSGYGSSGIATTPRDATGAERELSRLLEQTGIAGPYVLAGHSLGGLFAEYYAARHPDQVAAVILEDSRPVSFAQRCEAAGLSMCTPLPAMVKSLPRGVQDEVLALPTTTAEVEGAGAVRKKAVLVLSRPAGDSPWDSVWAAAQADLAARYPGSVHLVANDGGHNIHGDQPDWYVGAVEDFLDRLR
jgi:pimeloyl-ACP methyl ester carboxylesterase